MTSKDDLFGDWTTKVRRTDPDTSHEAARAAESMASWQHGLILRALRTAGRAMAPEEIADWLDLPGIDKVTIGRRMNELRTADRVHRVEKVVIRSNRQSWRYWLGPTPLDALPPEPS
jgi:hypothetical protein